MQLADHNPGLPDKSTGSEHGGIAWAAYLGISWTWCIGMFLPVLLVRDFGLAGFLVFALPNVIGAAAMGWMLRNAGQSRDFLRQHRAAAIAFSAVTICFHAFFLSWVVTGLIGPMAWIIAGLTAAICLPLFRRVSLTLAMSWIVLLASLILFFLVGRAAPTQWQTLHVKGILPSVNLLGLLPVCLFGFALCPYLDLTFHRARQSTSAIGGKLAFGIGFGVCFASMICFTLYYSHLLDPARWDQLAMNVKHFIAFHLAWQSGFTITAHLNAMMAQSRDESAKASTAIGRVVGWTLGLSPLLARMLIPAFQSPEKGELIYRLYMGFYGLVFPGYLWICHNRLSTRSLVALCLTIAVAAPLFWMGFIQNQMLWLIPGLIVILLARMISKSELISKDKVSLE